MRRLVGLVAFCSMLLGMGYVSDVSAARGFNQLRMEQLEKDPKVIEYMKLMRDQENAEEDQDFNQTTKNKKKKRKKKKRNRNNQANQMNQMDQMDQNLDFNQTTKKKKKKRKKKRGNRNNQVNQMNQIGQSNMMYRFEQSSERNSDNDFVLNEPIIDSSKFKKSSLIVEKDIKLASKDKTKKVEKKIAPVDLFLSKKESLEVKANSEGDVKLALNLDDSGRTVKEKLQQINNDRKAYNLIWTPNKKFKNDIQVNKFRAELNHYRKLYSENMKNA